jgi:hypothetical protein
MVLVEGLVGHGAHDGFDFYGQRLHREPCTCSSPPDLALSSPTAAATSPERTVVSAHRGSVSVVDATYLGREFNAVAMGLMPGSATVPQEPAKIS